MIVNLINSRQMFSLTLPNTIKGQYWITDIDDVGNPRQLISVEAIQGQWILKSNKKISVLDNNNQPVKSVALQSMSFLNLKLANSDERVMLFAESIDDTRQIFRKIVVKDSDVFHIGRSQENNFCYENRYVSSKHAKLAYENGRWRIFDTGSTNGTYVNGYSVDEKLLNAGDLIYIMGLKIIIGDNYFAINNPDNLLKFNSNNLWEYKPQEVVPVQDEAELPERTFFYRSPRFYREIKTEEIKIDAPPTAPKNDSMPMILMIAPSMTMGLASVSTSIITVINVINNGGKMIQAIPSLVMSMSMLLGTMLWPIVTKKIEKKNKIKNEAKRQEKYLYYLESIRDQIKRIGKEQTDILFENHISPMECAERIKNKTPNLWERSVGQSDFLRLRLGLGNLPLDVDVKCPEKKFTMDDDTLQDAMLYLGNEKKQLTNVPITISLYEKKYVGIYGPEVSNLNMLKNLILQIIGLHSYDEVKLMLIANENEMKELDFVRFIPHFWNDDKTERYLATNINDIKELAVCIEKNVLSRVKKELGRDDLEPTPYYIILSTDKKLSEKCEALQELLKLKQLYGVSVVHIANELKDLPKETETVIYSEFNYSRVFDMSDNTGIGNNFIADIVDDSIIREVSKDIANIELDMDSQKFSLPNMVTFLEMFNVGKIEHLNIQSRWKENNPTKTLQTPIGVDTYGGIFTLDLHEKFHGPHGLVAGMTGSGKSEFIITYILSLAINYHPDEVAFILIDYKGGGLTGAFEDEDRGIKLPHLAGTITNLDGSAVKRSLISIQSELRRRQAIFNEARKISNEGTMDIYKYQQLYRDKVVSEALPHLFIISDEFAELKAQQPEFMQQLISAARIGRSLGVHLILATQKPSGVVDDQIWSNSKFRVCLKVQDKSDSQDMIKCPDAAELSQTGRFYLQVGFNELFALGQSAWCGAEYMPSEEVEKTVDNSLEIIDNLGKTVMKVKADKKKVVSESKVKQIVAIVKHLSDIANEDNISVRALWLPPIPDKIYLEDIENKYAVRSSGFELNPVVGEYDDPFNQKQVALTIPLSQEGNCLIYGSTGNGKTTMLTTLCYSLIKNHTLDEVNLYIVDFGSETLKVFEKAPHVGDVICLSDNEKFINLLKMLHKEINNRKALFSEYGGEYSSYIKNSGRTIPNIVVVLNNYAAFNEQFEEYNDTFSLLSRDGVKYGIYFVVTAATTNAVRYRTQQNFKVMLTMQLNDASDYSMIVGKTDGLIPSKYKGRGLVGFDKVYEFQTAYCTNVNDQLEFVRNYCMNLNLQYGKGAKRVPVLPPVVDYDYVKPEIDNTSNIPIGVCKQALTMGTINLENKVAYPIVAQDISDMENLIAQLIKVVSDIRQTYVFDTDDVKQIESGIDEMFNELVVRNNAYKDANMDASVLEPFEEKIYIIVGLERLFTKLNSEYSDKFLTMLEKAEVIYKIRVIIIENNTMMKKHSIHNWYRKHISGLEGVWIGDGFTDQYAIKVNKLTRDLYEEIGLDYGYIVTKGKAILIKVLGSGLEE